MDEIKVYVVTTSDGDFTNIVAVFSSKEAAHEYCSIEEKISENIPRFYRFYVEEFVLDEDKVKWES